MDKKTIAFLKQKHPKLFSRVAKSFPLAYLASELDRLRYIYCMLFKKPYFGTVALSGQTWVERKPYMRQLVKNELSSTQNQPFYILEIGSWTGDSAILWANAIKESGKQGRVFCIDAWEPYLKTEKKERTNTATIIMDRALRKRRVFRLFLHNILTSGNNDIIHPLKGFSPQILPLLKERKYDIVFIDGDHSYAGVKFDLEKVEPLIRDGGIVCGDDLDLQLHEVDQEYSWQNQECNNVEDPQTRKTYHPGVTLAVAEFFKCRVTSYNGFWAMRRKSGQWVPVIIDYEEESKKA